MNRLPKNNHHSLITKLLVWARLDPVLMTFIILITAISLAVLYSVGGGDQGLLLRQLIRFTVALAAMCVMAQIPPYILRLWSPWLYALGVSMLIAVIVIGTEGKGAQRWLNLGAFRFQPSEMMKLAVPMAVAWYLGGLALPPTLKQTLTSVIIILVPMALIMQQPDLGTALLIGSAGFICLFMAGLSWRLIVVGAVLTSVVIPLMWFVLMHPYQKQRVLTFLNPETDPLGAGYHIIQSKIAIGSGGLLGKGWMNGTQSQLDFLPEQSTDFIFAVIAEEFGFVGVLLLLALYFLIVMRGLFIAIQARDSYSRLLASSISLTFFVYLVVNVGMVSGLLPVVGVPLPLVSYGGTSIVTLMAGFGILMSINTRRYFWRN